MVTKSIAVLPITEEVRKCKGQRTTSTCVMHYAKVDQEVTA